MLTIFCGCNPLGFQIDTEKGKLNLVKTKQGTIIPVKFPFKWFSNFRGDIKALFQYGLMIKFVFLR
jgi:hypothetical protein